MTTDARSAALPRRFYTAVEVVAQLDGVPPGFAITLDGRPVRTPRKAAVVVPTAALAQAVAAEWAAQTERIDPARMPLTRLVNSTIDTVAVHMEALRAEIVGYAVNDALCYRADGPGGLVARQVQAWDPVLAWAARDLDAVFHVTTGIVHAPQPPAACAAFAAAIAPLDAWQLAPLHVMTTLTGSAILALAVLRQAVTPAEAWSAAHVDEDWQIKQWGTDAEATARRATRWLEMSAAATMLTAGRE